MSDREITALGGMEEPARGSAAEVEATAAQGMVVPPELADSGTRRFDPVHIVLQVVPPAIVFVLLLAAWEYGAQLLQIPSYTLPTPGRILQTIPTIDELKHDAWYTSVNEALPGFLIGSGLGFLLAVVAMRVRLVARGVIPYAVISNAMPIIGIAPIAVALFGDEWQSKAVIVAILTFFPMMINAYRGLTSIDLLSLQLMQSYAASGWHTFFKLRLPASLPYIFNGLKINVTLAMIGAIVGEYFGGPAEGLGYYIHNQSGESGTTEVWAAVVVACIIGISVYMFMVLLERLFTSWHISYRSGR